MHKIAEGRVTSGQNDQKNFVTLCNVSIIWSIEIFGEIPMIEPTVSSSDSRTAEDTCSGHNDS